MNKIILYIFFTLGVILSSIFFTLGSYYFRIGEKKNIKFVYILLISVICGMISYSIKVPIFYYLGKELSIMIINIYFVSITFITVTLYSKFVLKEEIKLHTYIILTLIILLIICENILSKGNN